MVTAFQNKHSFYSKVVFGISLPIVILTVIPAVFPAFYIMLTNELRFPDGISPLEFGNHALPLLTVNFIILSTLFYFKQKKSKKINFLKKIQQFEVSRSVALFTLIVLIGIFSSFNITEIFENEPFSDFERTVKPVLESWNYDQLKKIDVHTIPNFLGFLSMEVFGSYRVIPFLGSVVLLVLTYFLTLEFSKKRFSGLIAVSIVITSNTFLTYDTTITYPNFWVILFLVSLYTIFKRWYFSPITFLIFLISKPISVLLFPITMIFIIFSPIKKKTKYFLGLSYGFLIILGTTLVVTGIFNLPDLSYDNNNFWMGFATISSQFRFDFLFILFLLPLMIALYMKSKRGDKYAVLVMIIITGMLFLAPFIPGFTTYTNNIHRFLPYVIFFGIGVGLLFSTKYQSSSRITVQKGKTESPDSTS